MNKPILPEQRVVFAVSPELETNNVIILLQVPPGGWDYMKDGTCHTFDLTKMGLPVKILLAGCESREQAMQIVNDANAAKGVTTIQNPQTDYSI